LAPPKLSASKKRNLKGHVPAIQFVKTFLSKCSFSLFFFPCPTKVFVNGFGSDSLTGGDVKSWDSKNTSFHQPHLRKVEPLQPKIVLGGLLAIFAQACQYEEFVLELCWM